MKDFTPFSISHLGMSALGIYMIIQIAIPLRHYFIDGYVDWTGDGQLFSWRMKIQSRSIEELEFSILDIDKKEIHVVAPNKHLYPDEISQMINSPKMIVQYAKYLQKVAGQNGIENCMVKSKVKVRFNQSESGYIFDPDIDLLEGAGQYDYYYQGINDVPPRAR